ncbi:hypothetical protein GF415_02170 [Candidatus Micrarchaeota archaeon]|nr:hypothetical protein [Candidatus Micrarchaeota archaeon]
MITSLSLKNWRTHKDTTLEFGRGTNLILGIMGSGKSGALNGLSYALFGSFPALKRRETSAGDVIMHGEEEAHIGLGFEQDGKKYRLHRILRKKGNKLSAAAKLYEGENVLETGQVRVTEAVSSLLGMDYDLFTRAVYSEQNNIDYFLTIDPGRRKKEMDRLLGLDRFEIARANSVYILNRVSSEAASASSIYNPEEHESCKKEHAEKTEKLSSLLEEKKKTEKALSELRGKIAPFQKSVSRLEKARKEREAAKSLMERSRARLEQLSSELEGKSPSRESLSAHREKLNALSKRREKLDSEIRTLEEEASALASQLGRVSALLESAKASSDSLSSLKKEIAKFGSPEELRASAEKKEQQLVSSSSKSESTANEIVDLEESAAALQPEQSECPLCGSGLPPEKKQQVLLDKKRKIETKKQALSELKKSIPRVKQELSTLHKSLRRLEQLQGKLPELSSRADALPELENKKILLKKRLSESNSRKKTLHEDRERLGQEHSRTLLEYREGESLLRKQESLKAREKECRDAEATLQSIKFSETELESARKSLEESRIKEERTSSRLEMLNRERAASEEMVSLLQERIKKMENAREQAVHLKGLEQDLVIYKNSLLDLQSELRSELTETISSAMNEIWPVIYPYADYGQIRLSATEKDYFFEVYDGEWRRLEKVASGGERACLSLTLRIALSTVLTPGVGWMMLDEPTHNLDRDAVHALSEALENKVPQIIPQSFVITHEEDLISSGFARSYKFSRDKESLGPTRVEAI